MKLNDKKLWLVTDPTPGSEWVDIFGDVSFDKLVKIILGVGLSTWNAENSAVYDNEREARRDAEKRWSKHTTEQTTTGRPRRYSYSRRQETGSSDG